MHVIMQHSQNRALSAAHLPGVIKDYVQQQFQGLDE